LRRFFHARIEKLSPVHTAAAYFQTKPASLGFGFVHV